MLDADFSPILADFRMAKLVSRDFNHEGIEMLFGSGMDLRHSHH